MKGMVAKPAKVGTVFAKISSTVCWSYAVDAATVATAAATPAGS